jgi:hypothetical protein
MVDTVIKKLLVSITIGKAIVWLLSPVSEFAFLTFRILGADMFSNGLDWLKDSKLVMTCFLL